MKVKPTSIGFNFRCATYKKFSWGGGGGGGGNLIFFGKISQFTTNFIDRTPCIEQAQARVPRNLSC